MLTPICLLAARTIFLMTSCVLAGTGAAFADGDSADQALAKINPQSIRANMRFLADDLLEGRGTATRGHEVAAKFMATRFEAMGLIPAGDAGTYLQRVPLRSMKIDPGKSAMAWVRAGKAHTFVAAEDYLLRPDPSRHVISAEAPVVFVGFGVTTPEQHYDDYKGIDVRGKIVAVISAAPHFESAISAHFTSTLIKARNAVAHGAVGLIVLDDPTLEGEYPFAQQARDAGKPSFRWLDQRGLPNDATPELRGVAFLSMRATQELFEGSRYTADQVFKMAKAGALKSFGLPLTIKMATTTDWVDVQSSNVVAKIEGSDPALKDEYVVYSAHLDHLGIGDPVKGDSIYNGALDNASGAAILLEIARAFTELKPAPRRSILFLSGTAEEMGLLGSDYFAHNPTVPHDSLVADLDVDTDFMLWPLQDVVAFGAEHSNLKAAVQQAAGRLHLVSSPDPAPEQALFIRGDNYSFVKQGIPSVALSPGVKSDNPKTKPIEIAGQWLQTRYHQPSDDMEQPGLDFDEAVKFARFVFLAGQAIADGTQRPRWNQGDFFAELYGTRAN